MNYLIIFFAMVSYMANATQMEGFGTVYYQDDSSIPNYNTDKGLVPDIIIGDDIYVLEIIKLADIAKKTDITVNQGDQASWICLASKDSNYWFISDNEMGGGYLTSIAISRDGPQKECSPYGGDLSVTVKGISLLNASRKFLSTTFKNKPDGDAVQYCTDTKSYGDFTQINCLQYYFEKNSVKGVLISQVTSN